MARFHALSGCTTQAGRVLLAATALFAVASPGLAWADGGVQPPASRPLTTVRVMESLRIADEFIGHPAPCPVRVFAATVNEMVAFTGEAAAAATFLDACRESGEARIWLSDTLGASYVENRVEVCTDIVHERLHVEGVDHDLAPLSVMNLHAEVAVYGCYQRFVPAGWRRRWRAENPGTGWAALPW